MSSDLLVLEKELVTPVPTYMIAGFNGWSNTGNVSSGIPDYLIQKLRAKKIGRIRRGDFYIYQLPGRGDMFRPPVKYEGGFEVEYHEEPINDFHYAQIDDKGLVIFIGSEPIQHEDVYTNLILDAAEKFGVRRIFVPAGVGSAVPVDKERMVTCIYSLRGMKEELERYAVGLLDFRIGATIGMVMNHYAKERGMGFVRMTAWTPVYNFFVDNQPFTLGPDTKAVFDILKRVRYMFKLDLDLSDLHEESERYVSNARMRLDSLALKNPQLKEILQKLDSEFKELQFEEPVELSSSIEDVLREATRPPKGE